MIGLAYCDRAGRIYYDERGRRWPTAVLFAKRTGMN